MILISMTGYPWSWSIPTGLLARVLLSSDDRNLFNSEDIQDVKETILAPQLIGSEFLLVSQ
jgi:hypothetical protein